MEAGKHGGSSPEKDNDDSSGIGRSYECTFCKRGFTNAQALGGHMNIHRKDKAKTKQQKNQDEDLKNNKSKEALNYSRFVPHHVSSADHRAQMGYQLFLPTWNPNFQTASYLPPLRPDRYEANLSLRIGVSSQTGNQDGEGGSVESNLKENEVDLELRLGP